MKETDEGTAIRVKAMPNAGKTALAGEYNGMLKVKVAARPEKGKANEELSGYFAELLGVSRSRVSVIKGMTSREKTVFVCGVKKHEITGLLEAENG